MSTVDEYRRFAAECLRHAQQAQNPNDAARLIEMAQAWQELAKKAEIAERSPKKDPNGDKRE
jgi:hypothetical protein